MNTPVLQARNLRKSFSFPTEIAILDDISLDLFAGESIAIMGPSGEGKSTLLHILGTLEEPTSGTITIDGVIADGANAPRLRNKNIGFVFQSFNLLDDYTVLENVLMPAKISGHSFKQGREKGMELLDSVGLSHRASFATKLLSGGEKQRVAIARALCNDPGILLADEPSGNLDHSSQMKIHELLLQASSKQKKGLIIVTHHSGLSSLCDRKLILCAGKLS